MENLRETRISETRVEGRERERERELLIVATVIRQTVCHQIFSDVLKDNRRGERRIREESPLRFFSFYIRSAAGRASSSDNGRGISGDYVPFPIFRKILENHSLCTIFCFVTNVKFPIFSFFFLYIYIFRMEMKFPLQNIGGNQRI